MARSGRTSNGDAFRKLNVALKDLHGVNGRVGYVEPATYPDGPSVALVAAVQELGHGPSGIPPRPTLGPTIEAKAPTYRDQFAKGARAILRGEQTALTVMEAMVLVAAGDVKQSISELQSPPLKPATIRRKGSAKPLIESGQMIQAVTGVAERAK